MKIERKLEGSFDVSFADCPFRRGPSSLLKTAWPYTHGHGGGFTVYAFGYIQRW